MALERTPVTTGPTMATITLPITADSFPTASTGSGSDRPASTRTSNSKPKSKAKARSISKKSGSASAPPSKKASLPRWRTLKRGCSFRPLEDGDLKYLWAAYRRGAFDKAPRFVPAGLDADGFRAAATEWFANFAAAGGEVYALIGKTVHGAIPVGMAVLSTGGDFAEPHAVWFPEASRRNKLELALAFLIEQKRRHKLLIWVRASDWKLFDHICKYGAIRTVGKYRGYFPDGEDAFLFQGVNV